MQKLCENQSFSYTSGEPQGNLKGTSKEPQRRNYMKTISFHTPQANLKGTSKEPQRRNCMKTNSLVTFEVSRLGTLKF